MGNKKKIRRPKSRGLGPDEQAAAQARRLGLPAADRQVNFRELSAADLSVGFNQLARKCCSECGAPVRWVDVAEARAHGMDVDQALAFFDMSPQDAEFAEWWVCTGCDNAGLMGPPQFG